MIGNGPGRNTKIIGVVEQALDIGAIEKTGKYNGIYHVLGGSINPLANIGPDELTIDKLISRVKSNTIDELILATNPDMEGEATAMYIRRELKTQNSKLKITRLAHGLPVGADIEYADEVTLGKALEGRDDF